MIVVNAMMTLELPYVRERFNKFLSMYSKVADHSNVFKRLVMDHFFREQRDAFLKYVLTKENQDSTVIQKANQENSYKPTPPETPQDDSADALKKKKFEPEPIKPEINWADLDYFLKNNGEVKDLINKPLFTVIFN